MSIVICGFSGIGKSTAEQKHRRIVDMESSIFSRCWDNTNGFGARNENFPQNYIDRLEEFMADNHADFYLLSCHKEVRDELKKRGIPYLIVLPYPDCKNAYLKRWLKRGSDMEFITSMSDRWEQMIASCEDDGAPKIYLGENEYIADILIC